MPIYDITRRLSPAVAVWPGDTPFALDFKARRANGDSVNLTTLTVSAHTGTHIDAHFHYDDDGLRTAEMPLEPFMGPCTVVSVDKADGPLTPDDFPGLDFSRVQRLLIHSPSSTRSDDEWRDAFPYPSPALIDALAAGGAVLIGVDSPSVDAFDSKDMPGHQAVNQHGLVILENVNLNGIPDGEYELIALPLKIDGGCGSPVRAVLRTV